MTQLTFGTKVFTVPKRDDLPFKVAQNEYCEGGGIVWSLTPIQMESGRICSLLSCPELPWACLIMPSASGVGGFDLKLFLTKKELWTEIPFYKRLEAKSQATSCIIEILEEAASRIRSFEEIDFERLAALEPRKLFYEGVQWFITNCTPHFPLSED